MKWQPIETAPKDGQLILIHEPYRGPVVAMWQPYYREFTAAYGDDEVTCHPTHWMPLPAGPTTSTT